jgi:hypothetical protein
MIFMVVVMVSMAALYQTANFLDSPATTSSTTYKIQILASGSGTAYVNRRRHRYNLVVNLQCYIMEIAG